MTFAQWQGEYAAHGIPTFPVRIGPEGKKPMVSNYAKFGLRGSAELVPKFGTATGIGFMAGKRSRICVVDVDTLDEDVLTDALDRHGQTPIIARTGSGKFHAYYRHNGEDRMIRPEKDRPIDILGGGFVTAPPSRGLLEKYQFIAGGLDDLDRLPVMLDVPGGTTKICTATEGPAYDLPSVKHGERNNTLFRNCLRAAHSCNDLDALLGVARTLNADFFPPLKDEEVFKLATSAWRYQVEDRNYAGGRVAVFTEDDVMRLVRDPEVFALFAFLKARNKPDAEFWIADGLAKHLHWSLHRLRGARRRVMKICPIRRVRPPGNGKPALYVFSSQKS